MNPRHIILPGIVAAFVLAVGCATDGSRSTNERRATLVYQEQARHLVLTYRRQVTGLRELAQRLTFEAQYRSESGLNSHESEPRLAQAKALLASAQKAETWRGNISSRFPMDKSSDEASRLRSRVKLRQQPVVRHN